MKALYLGILNRKKPASVFLENAIKASLHNSFIELYIYEDHNYDNHVKFKITKNSIKEIAWDIIIIQNSYCLKKYEEIFKLIRKNVPIVFFSHEKGIDGQIDLSKKIGRIFFTKGSYYGQFNTLPHTVYKQIKIPAKTYKRRNTNNDRKTIIFYLTDRNFDICFNLVSFYLSKTEYKVVFVNDSVRCVYGANKPEIKIVTRKQSENVLTNAGLVIGSGCDIVQAMSIGVPAIILGDYGLGGRVTVNNYELQKENEFKGRLGGSRDEHIPLDLAFYQIRSGLKDSSLEEALLLKNKILEDYSFNFFRKNLLEEIKKVVSVSSSLNTKKHFLTLKPYLIKNLNIQTINNSLYIVLNNNAGIEIEHSFYSIITEQCNGIKTITEIRNECNIPEHDIPVFYSNLKMLWDNGFIVFI